jgi:hypothetical protein
MVKELRAFSMRFMNKNKDDFIIKAMGIFISKSKTVKQEEYSLDPEIEAVYQDAEEIEEELKRINIANWNVKLSDGYHLETGREQVVGTTTYVVESVAGALRAQGHTVTEYNIEVQTQPDLTQSQLLVLVALLVFTLCSSCCLNASQPLRGYNKIT